MVNILKKNNLKIMNFSYLKIGHIFRALIVSKIAQFGPMNLL